MALIIKKNGAVINANAPYENGVLEDAIVLLTDPAAGDTITFDGTKWVVGKPILALEIEDPEDGDVLTYDGTAGAWKNVAPTPTEVTPAEET